MPRPQKLNQLAPAKRQHVPSVERRALPIQAFARAYGVHPVTVWRALKTGRLKSVTIGKRRLVLLDSVGEPM
jgi:IS30 family transposase